MDHPLDTRGDALATARRTVELEANGLTALRDALDGPLGEAFERAVAGIRRVQEAGGRLMVTGMGKSGHVGRKLSATLTSTGTHAYFVHPGEASHGDLGMIRADDAVLALSWSGEAPELSDILAYTRRFGVLLVAITSSAGSTLGAAADVPLVLPAMPEACPNGLAPTTSTTMQMAMGDALAVALLSRRGFTASDFRQFHPGGKLGARLRKVQDLMHVGMELPMVPDTALLSEAIMEMTQKRFGITAVVDGRGVLAGVVTDGDLRRAFTRGFHDERVVDMMARAPRTIERDAMAEEALAKLQEWQITSLFVVEEGRPVGIIHLHDLLRTGVI